MKELVIGLLEWLMDLGYLGVALGLMVEVIPSELVLSYGGYLVSQGRLSFTGAVIAGTIGGTLAQLFLYWMGYYGGRPFLEKYGKYILISKKQIDLSEKWFEKYGTGVIFFARFIPVVRHAISIPAGIARMTWIRFTFYTVLAIIPWSIFFIYLGTELGTNWQNIKTYAAPFTRGIMIAALIFIAIMILLKVKKGKSGK
jgi:membrane protein DedA with SNARE-associated domain